MLEVDCIFDILVIISRRTIPENGAGDIVGGGGLILDRCTVGDPIFGKFGWG